MKPKYLALTSVMTYMELLKTLFYRAMLNTKRN